MFEDLRREAQEVKTVVAAQMLGVPLLKRMTRGGRRGVRYPASDK